MNPSDFKNRKGPPWFNNDDNNHHQIERHKSHCATNCHRHAHSSGQGAILYKSCATHRVLITCNMSRASRCERTVQLLSLTVLKSHLFHNNYDVPRCETKLNFETEFLLTARASDWDFQRSLHRSYSLHLCIRSQGFIRQTGDRTRGCGGGMGWVSVKIASVRMFRF